MSKHPPPLKPAAIQQPGLVLPAQVAFADLMEAGPFNAIQVAHTYLLKGIGIHVPKPPIDGVREIHVTLKRPFGELPTSTDPARLEFLYRWEHTELRQALLNELGITDHPQLPGVKARAQQQYVSQHALRMRQQRASSEYEVAFIGSAGSWSAVFFIGCTAFDQRAALASSGDVTGEVEDDDCFFDGVIL